MLGQSEPRERPPVPLPLRYLGRFHDDLSLALVYAAADLVLVPSRLDNLPQSATEPLACGTPVVAFRQGGMTDLIEHRVNGWLAEPDSPQSLVEGIRWCLHQTSLRTNASVLETWRPRAVAQAHRSLYERLITR